MMPPNLLTLPLEIAYCILVETSAEDVARLCCCCHTLNNYIRNNRLLFKGLYLRNFVRKTSNIFMIVYRSQIDPRMSPRISQMVTLSGRANYPSWLNSRKYYNLMILKKKYEFCPEFLVLSNSGLRDLNWKLC